MGVNRPIAQSRTDCGARQRPAEIESALTAIGSEPGGRLIMMPDAFTTVHRQLIILLVAARYALPAIYPHRYQAVDGGSLWYGVAT
jgi:putative tryptophan/tyrosine transport system substrate-binding protein